MAKKTTFLHVVDWKDTAFLPGQSKENTIFSVSWGQFEEVNLWVHRWHCWSSQPAKGQEPSEEDFGTDE